MGWLVFVSVFYFIYESLVWFVSIVVDGLVLIPFELCGCWKAFIKRCNKGKKKELSPQDAALLIQMTFRSYLARRSQILRCLRELAVAKARLKEIRAIFYNFSYRRRVANDAEERQRFSEKIIVLLLTVEAVEVIYNDYKLYNFFMAISWHTLLK